MKTKLTLSIEKGVIEEARALLKEEGQNLSKTFEEYLKALISRKKKEKNYSKGEDDLLPEVREIAGIFYTPGQDERDYKVILQEELIKERERKSK